MQQKYRAIVIDDKDFCRELLTEYLEERGYQVVSFADVTSCSIFSARVGECTKPEACADLLLTDNRMPHMHGIDFLKLQELKKCHIAASQKAIISGDLSQGARQRAEQLGCKTFHKPLDLKMLDSWLDEQEKLISDANNLVNPEETMTEEEQKNTD